MTTRNASDPYQASPGAKPALEPTTSGIQICHPDFAVAWTVYPLRQAELHWTPSSHRWGGNHGGRWARRRQPWKAVSAISQLWEPLYLVPWARTWRWPAGCGGGGDRKMGWSSAARLPRQPSTHVLPFRRCVSDPLLKGPELTWLALWGAGPLYKKMHLLRVPGAMKTPPHQQLMMFSHTAHNRQKVGTAQGVHQQVSGKTSVTGLHSGMFPSQKKE